MTTRPAITQFYNALNPIDKTEQDFANTLAQLLDYLSGLLGDDGSMTTLRTRLGLPGTPVTFTNRGAYASGTVYAANDLVTSASVTYLCVLGYTGTATLPAADPTHWMVWQGVTSSQLNSTLLTLDNNGAIGDGTTDDTTAVNTAIVANKGRSVRGRNADYLVTGSYLNKYTLVEMGARIKKAITGGFQQLNTYADWGKLYVGKEYRYPLFQLLNAGASEIRVNVYGNSTMTDPYTDAALNLVNLIPAFFAARGVGAKITVTNRSVTGTSIEDLDLITDVASGTPPHLAIIKYDTNEGSFAGDRLTRTADAWISKMTAVRAHANGTIGTLCIAVCSGNGVSDTPNGRDEYWMEQLRPMHERNARRFYLFFADCYAYSQDWRNAATLWGDNPYTDGRSIHPTNTGQAQLMGFLFAGLLGQEEMLVWARNIVTNLSSAVGVTAASVLPNSLPFGVTMRRALPADGWPADGMVMMFRQPDGVVLQINSTYATTVPRMHVRCGDPSGNVWSRWSGIAENLSFTGASGAWANSDTAIWGNAQALIDNDGIVQSNFYVSGGTKTAGSVVLTFPAGMRPLKNIPVVLGVITNASATPGFVNAYVASNGQLILHTTMTGDHLAGSISFRAA